MNKRSFQQLSCYKIFLPLTCFLLLLSSFVFLRFKAINQQVIPQVLSAFGEELIVQEGLKVGIQVGHWLNGQLPEELEKLRIFVNVKVSESLSALQQTDSVPSDSMEESTAITIAKGQFSGFDALHQSSGTAKLIKIDGKYFIRFEDDFSVTNRPDLFVHLGKDGKYDPKARLGVLKGNQGSQNYEITSPLNIDYYSEV